MISLNLNIKSFPNPISGCQWLGRHVQPLTIQPTWRQVAGGLLLLAVASYVVRIAYQKLVAARTPPRPTLPPRPTPIVAEAFLDMRPESAKIVGTDEEFNFKDHLKTPAGIPIIPDAVDFYVFLQINDPEHRRMLQEKICGVEKVLSYQFKHREPLFKAVIEEGLYLEGIILPSTLFQEGQDEISFQWDNQPITLTLKVDMRKFRASHLKPFPALHQVIGNKTLQLGFQECFRMLETMKRYDGHEILSPINLGKKFDFKSLTPEAQFYSPEGLSELTPVKLANIEKILKTASPFPNLTKDQVLYIVTENPNIFAIIDQRCIILAGHEEKPQPISEREHILTPNLDHYLVIRSEHDIDPASFKIELLANHQARVSYKTTSATK